MSEQNEARTALAESLRKRTPTWVVAEQILALQLELPTALNRSLTTLANERSWSWQMNDDFDQPQPLSSKQLDSYQALFPFFKLPISETDDPQIVAGLVDAGMTALGCSGLQPAEALSLLQHNHLHSKTEMSKSALRKRLRLLRRFDRKEQTLRQMLRLRHAQQQAKSRLAYQVETEDDLTLAFCAYLAARANRRSQFMIGQQSKAQDEISAGLQQLMIERGGDWFAAALVKPTVSVIRRLDASQKGMLVGLYHEQMKIAATQLQKLYPTLPERMREEMVMVSGVDSSSWNAFAGALNTMRSAWISALLACDMDYVLDSYCPGKAPRLMAADLVWMYRDRGMQLHEDTRMFNLLPLPWDVIANATQLGREQILAAAKTADVDAAVSGWVGPRSNFELEHSEAEPALVHGIAVADPGLAYTLRRCGVFSGKQLKNAQQLPASILRATVHQDGKEQPVVIGALDEQMTQWLSNLDEQAATGKSDSAPG